MRKNKYIILLLILILLITSCKKNNNINEDEHNNSDIPQENPIDEEEQIDEIEKLIKNMTIEEKIGQLLIVGKEGYELNEDDIYQIETNKVGGFIFFAKNIENSNQVLNMLNSLKGKNKVNKFPLFLSIDEEGGRVTRLEKIFKRLPTPLKIGLKNDKDISTEYGEILGSMLNAFGFNIDFAPVLDINSNPKNPVIGDRAFGNNAETVSNNGLLVMDGIRSEGIISGVKHFPGHGDTSVDSHLELPRIGKSLEDLEKLELVPFKKAIEKDVDIIMVAHILFANVDSEFPSSMSREIISNLLREKLKYNGVVISDDITMGAIDKNYSIEEGALQFLKAGGDIILICHGKDNPNLIKEAILKSINNNEISEEIINEKLYRILSLKYKYNLKDGKVENIDIQNIINRIEKFNKQI